MNQTTTLGDYEQAILDSCDDETIMKVNEMLANVWDFYEALKSLGLF